MKISRRFPRSPRVYVFHACVILDYLVSSLARIQIHRTALGQISCFMPKELIQC